MHIQRKNNSGIAIYPPGASFGPRNMLEYEFVWMIEGQAEYHHNGVVTILPPGSILLCQPGFHDFFQWDRESRTTHAFVHFTAESLPDGYPPQAEWPLYHVLPDDDIFRPLFRNLMTWQNSQPSYLAESTLMELLNAFVFGRLTTTSIDQKSWPDIVQKAFARIYRSVNADPGAQITPAELASSIFVSQTHLCRLFKDATGLTTAQIIRYARLDYAAALIARSNYSIGEISSICGFSDQFHFTHLFRKAFSMAPSQVKKSGVQPDRLLIWRV